MIAVIFEVIPHKQYVDTYLTIAGQLRAELEKIEGFISVERFQSLTDETKILSLSFFENEEAVARWRNLEEHRQAQSTARSKLFQDYRLRIAHVVRDYTKTERAQCPHDSQALHGS